MLLHRYHDLDCVFRLDADVGISLILKAMELERDERLFRQWTAQLPLMAYTGEYMSFESYKERATGANIDRRPTAVLEAELDEVEKLLHGGVVNGA